jgi:hypothetical protein
LEDVACQEGHSVFNSLLGDKLLGDKMTRKHYNELARSFQLLYAGSKGARKSGVLCAALAFAEVAKKDNPNFDKSRFLRACGIE